MSTQTWLTDHVAYVTGGASGLGRAVVRRFVAEGAIVAVLDRDAERLDGLREEHGDAVIPVAGDVRSLADHQTAVDAALGAHGRLDVLVACAAVWDYAASLLNLPDDRIDAAFTELFDINVKGYLLAAKAAAPALIESQGRIILTGSNASTHPDGGGPLYTSSKHAVVGLVRQLAHELAPKVLVNGVAPGGMLTDLRGPASLGMDGMRLSDMPLDGAEALVPLNRFPKPEEMTGQYVALASKENVGPMTGEMIYVDGGLRARGLLRLAGGAGEVDDPRAAALSSQAGSGA